MATQPNALIRQYQELADFKLEPHYTIPELEQALRVSRFSLYRYIQDGLLHAVSVGAEWRVSQTAINQFLQMPLLPRNKRTRVAKRRNNGRPRIKFSLPQINPPEADPPAQS